MEYGVKENFFEKIGNTLAIYEREGVMSYKFRRLISPLNLWKEVLTETIKQHGDNRKALENLGLLNCDLDALMILDRDNGNPTAYSLSYYLKHGTVWRPTNFYVPTN